MTPAAMRDYVDRDRRRLTNLSAGLAGVGGAFVGDVLGSEMTTPGDKWWHYRKPISRPKRLGVTALGGATAAGLLYGLTRAGFKIDDILMGGHPADRYKKSLSKTAGVGAAVYKVLKKMRNIYGNVRTEKDAKKLLKATKEWTSKTKQLSNQYGKKQVEGIAEKLVGTGGPAGSKGKLINRIGDTVSKARGDGSGLRTKLVKGGWLPE